MSGKSKNIELKAGVWYMVGSFMNKAVAIFLVPILTRMLTKEEYGNFSNFSAWCSILLVITSLNIANTVIRAKYDFEEDYDAYMSSVSVSLIISTVFFYLIIRMFSFWFTKLFDMEMRYINIMFLYLIGEPVYNCYIAQQRVLLKYKVASIVSVICPVVNMVLSIFLVSVFEDKLMGRIVGYVLPPFLLGIVLYGIFLYKGKKVVWEMIKYALAISIPLIPHNLSNGILASSDRIFIKKFCSAEFVAYYNLGYNIALIVALFQQSINKAYVPWFYKKLNREKVNGIRRLTVVMVLVFLAMTISVLLIAPEIIFILGGKKYMIAVGIVPVVVVGCFFQYIYTLYVNFELFLKKTWVVSLGTMIAAGMNIVLNIIFIPKFGYEAAAYTTLIGYAIQYSIHYLFVSRTKYRDVLNNRLIIFVALGSIFLIPLFLQIYKFNAVRWILLTVYILIGIFCLSILLKKKRSSCKKGKW